MTNPFQSIIGAVPNGLSVHCIRQDHSPSVSVELSPIRIAKEQPIGDIKTGLADACALRKPLCGGTYGPDDALQLLNSHYFVGKNERETAIFRIDKDGTATFVPTEQFKLEIQNIFVLKKPPDGSTKTVSAEKFWKEHPRRHQRVMVFKPGVKTQPYEFNLWRGYGVEARKGWQKQRRLVRHIYEVICRSDKGKFKYLMKYLAWCVQHPDKHSGAVIVLKSRKQGTGKTTLGDVMLKIFGEHGARIDNKDRLLGRFNDWLETACFVLLEEATWAGDLASADKLKSLITGDTLQVERKFGTCRQVPNRLKSIATTNHDHAVHAGVQDRRNVVMDVDDVRAGDRAWFDKLHQDLADGGTSEFLYFLQHLQLGDWHPQRNILKTAETAEQQRMSSDSVSQWAQACIDADAIVGALRGPYGIDETQDLGSRISLATLYEAYKGYCKHHPVDPVSFGRACTAMFGDRKRLNANKQSSGTGKRKRRPWGYDVPTGKKWQERLDARLGIKK